MSAYICTFEKNGINSSKTDFGACLEDIYGNQIQVGTNDSGGHNTHLQISMRNFKDVISMETGFLTLGTHEESLKVWCRYDKGLFYFIVWYMKDSMYNGMFGLTSDSIKKTPTTPAKFLKYLSENPDLSVDRFLRSNVIQLAIKNS